MKIQYLAYGILITMAASCTIVNPDIRYEPKEAEEYIFPMQSVEFTKLVEDCIEQENFPCNYPEPQDSLDEFRNTWYSKHLISLEEPRIYTQRGNDWKIIRYTNLGTWSNPYSIRIENRNGKILGTYSKSKGLGGYQAGRRIKFKEKKLTEKEWGEIELKIDKIEFWQIPTHDPNIILDGEEWILEILWNDKYHFVTRNSPDVYDGKEYAELCNLIENTLKEEK